MLGLLLSCTALQLPSSKQAPSTRRAVLGSGAAVAAALALPGTASAGLKSCKGGSQNCYSTAGPPGKNELTKWSWPSGMSRADAAKSLKSVLDAYPQSGQVPWHARGEPCAFATCSEARLRLLHRMASMAVAGRSLRTSSLLPDTRGTSSSPPARATSPSSSTAASLSPTTWRSASRTTL